LSHADITREAVRNGIVASISCATVWRWMSNDAIKPWQYRSWIFPRDPDFAKKASYVLDLYQSIWNRKRLGPNDFVISADEKTSIQARNRKGLTTAPAPNHIRRVEFEYQRGAAHWLTLPPGMFEEQRFLAFVRQKPALILSDGWLISS